MVVTATDLKTNLGKYLDLLDTNDIIITRNGRRVARLIRDEEDVLAEVQSLFGILSLPKESVQVAPEEISNARERDERTSRYDSIDWYQRNT